jgi:hypothetical protein
LSLYIDAKAPPWPIYRHRRNFLTLHIKKIPQDRTHVPPQLILRSAHQHKAAHLPAAGVNKAGVALYDFDIDFDATQHPNVPFARATIGLPCPPVTLQSIGTTVALTI